MGLTAATQANALPTKEYVTEAPGAREDFAARPSYDGDVVRVHAPWNAIAEDASDRTTVRKDGPEAQALRLPAASRARTE